MNEWLRRFQNRRRVPDAPADAASGWRDAAEFRARAPDVSGGRRADRRRGRACCVSACASVGVPDLAAAALALGGGAILTGALHEDGLADVADGFGGGRDLAAKLEIMRDSRLGTYGAVILLVSFAAKLSALAAIPDGYVVPALIAAHALARGVLPAMSLNLPYARKDGLARNAGQPDAATAAIAGGLALAHRAACRCRGATRCSPRCVAGLSGLAHRVAGACGRSAARPATCSAAPSRSRETAILLLLAARLAQRMSARDQSLADPPRAGRWTARRDSCAPTRRPIFGDAAAFAALKARLPAGALAVCSPARRTRETARALGLDAVEQASLSRAGFRRLDRPPPRRSRRRTRRGLSRILEIAASNRPPGGESFVDQIDARERRPRASAGGRGDPRGAFRHHPRRARHRARSRARSPRCVS